MFCDFFRKKIIVKVPHVIKHIHHDIFQPVHIHKVKGKKLEHHHHEEHKEEIKGWKPLKKPGHKKIRHYKPHGSYSQIQPVLAHQNVEDHMEYPSSARQEEALPQEHRLGHDFIQEEILHLGSNPGKRKAKYIGGKGTTSKFAPWGIRGWKDQDDYSGEALEDFDDYSEEHESTRVKATPANGQRRKRHKNIKSRANYVSLEERTKGKNISPLMEDSGWTPLQNFDGWRDFNNVGKKPRGQSNIFMNYGEGRNFGGNFEEHIYEIERDFSDDEYHPEEYQKPKRSKKNKPKWSKQIDVREPISEAENSFDTNDQRNSYQVETPQRFPPQYLSSQTHPNMQVKPPIAMQVNFQNEPFNHHTHQNQPTSWSLQVQQPQPTQKSYSLKQPSNSIWNTQPTPVAPPTHSPKMVWSGHHLQMPQSSMWHVQQHSVQGDSTQMFMHPPLQVHQASPPPPLQLQQGSTLGKQVLPPGWPLTQKSPGAHSPVRQQWEQHVQTSGSGGPASSYKLEVINYMDQKKGQR